MKQNDFSCSEMLDAHAEELLQELQQRRGIVGAPESRMVHDIQHAYQAETFEDARSLERVLARLREDQVEAKPKVLFFPHVYQQQERISTMQSSLDTFAGGKTSRKWQSRAGVLAAILFLTLLVGGLLTVLNVIHAGPTAQVTSPASSVVTSVELSDNTNQAGQATTVQHFMVGQTIWLTGMINLGKTSGSGVLTVKWYENDHLYATSRRDFQTPKDQSVSTALKAITLRAHQAYGEPGNGKAEVYWNGQLVTTLHFVIEQSPKK